jgi:serine/threonine protein kinase
MMKPAEVHEPKEADGKELADLVEEFAARTQAGEPLDLEDYVRAHPAQADELRRLLPAVQALAELGRSAAGEAVGGDACLTGQLGDFRIVREVGRGGMGVVYEAEQVSLRRRVALKVLPSAAALDSKHLQRFKNEAHAAALLQHPHIVPVIAVGEDQGAHFFAMQFIDGRSLASLIADLRARVLAGESTVIVGDPRALVAGDSPRITTEGPAGRSPGETHIAIDTPMPVGNPLVTGRPGRDRAYFRAAARLLMQAARALDHAHQVGIIHRDVKPANFLVEDRGHLWVTDFGLARLHSSAALTATGDLLGTLRYMSPEQAQGRRVPIDHRTDVYSLGASAYEVLTLQHAFPGDDRQELLRRITTEDPARPRRINRAVPSELEAVVLKAMEKDPADRYATAQEMADDLERFLADQPVRARHPAKWRVAVKWARRHGGLVTTVVAAVFMVLAVTVALLTVKNQQIREQEGKTREALEKAQEQEAGAREDRRKAEANARKANRNARQALDALNGLVLDLAAAQVFQDPKLKGKARATLANALKVYEDLAKDEAVDRMELALGFYKVGDIYTYLGDHEDSQKAYRRSIDLAQHLVDLKPKDWQCRLSLSFFHRAFGNLYRTAGRRQEAAAAFRKAVDCWNQPSVLQHCPVMVSTSHQALAEIATEEGNVKEAMDHYRAAIAEGPGLTAVTGEANANSMLAGWHRHLGLLLQEEGRPDEAENHYFQAKELVEGVVEGGGAKENLVQPRYLLAQCWYHRAALREEAEPDQARRFYEKSLKLLAELLAESPGMVDRRSMVADAHHHLGILTWAMGLRKEAAEHFRAARDDMSKLAAEVPGGGAGPGEPGHNENDLAWFLATCPDESFRDLPRALEFARKATARAPSRGDFWNTLGVACFRSGDNKGAIDALEKSVELLKGSDPTDWFYLALAHHRLGDPSKAHACYDKGVAWVKDHKTVGMSLRLLRDEAAAALRVRPDDKGGKQGSVK